MAALQDGGTAALANGLPDQILLQPETLPASGASGSGSSLFFWVKTACEENEQAP